MEIKIKVMIVIIEEKDIKKDFVGLEEVDMDKIKVVLEKRRKLWGGFEVKFFGVKYELINEEELLEREFESGVDIVVEVEKFVKERRDKKLSRGE